MRHVSAHTLSLVTFSGASAGHGADTTNFSGTVTITDQPLNDRFFTNFFGTGQVGTLGTALLSMSRNQQLADDGISGVGQSGAA